MPSDIKDICNPALKGATEEYHKKRLVSRAQSRRYEALDAKGMTRWVCECGHAERVPKNTAMGFEDWSGRLVCPNCNRSMEKEEPDVIPV